MQTDANSDLGDKPLWRWPELAQALGCPDGGPGPAIHGVSIDSRTANPGDLFIALAGDPGPRFFTSSPGQRDGHDFVGKAADAGAVAAMITRGQNAALAQLQVNDTLDGLWDLARAAVDRHNGVRVAITGSSGKTTAKAFLAAALPARAETGSLNNFWGVPLCLARTPRDAPAAVFEIGTNQAGEIAPLSELVQPQVAVLLNVHPAHIGNFASLRALREEKLSIISGLKDLSKFVCEHSVAVEAGLQSRVLTFGEQRAADIRLRQQAGGRAALDTPDGAFDVRIPGGGKHRGLTLAAVAAVLVQLGEDPRRAAELPGALVPRGRGNERVVKRPEGDEWVVIDDSYNANPVSMAAALQALSGATGARFALLGEMLELGEEAERYHEELASQCANLDGVYCVGAGARVLFEALPAERRLGYSNTVADIDLAGLIGSLPAAGTLLVKGSNRVFWQHDYCEQLLQAFNTSSA